MKFVKRLLLVAIMSLSVLPTMAQGSSGDVDEVTGSVKKKRVLGAINWMKDGEGYSTMEMNEKYGGDDIVRYEAKDDKRSILIGAEQLLNPATGKHIGVTSIQWSTDNHKVLIFTNTKRVWRYNTKGDYWVLDLESGELKQLGRDVPESTMMFAKFSPDDKKVAYVSLNNIYVEDLASGKTTQITKDGSDSIINGTFDWAYEEEFSCRDGFRWSSDSKHIAYWQSDTEGTGVFTMINNIDSIYPKLIPLPYPKAGTTNSAVKVGYIAVDGSDNHWFNIPGDPRNNYIPRMEFIPGTNELIIQQLNRAQNSNKIWIAEIGKEQPKNIFEDNDAAWLDTNDNILWTKDNEYFTWESDRSGWRQLYFISRDGKEIKPITSGKFDIVTQVGIDQKRGYLYFISTMDNYTQRYLYRANLNGKGEPVRISAMDQEGQHTYNMSPTASWAIHTFSNAHTPHYITMEQFPQNKAVRVVQDNEDALAKYSAGEFTPKEFIKLDIGYITLDAYMIKPKDFDPSKKYPVIIEVYGEPAGSTVQDIWNGGDLAAHQQADKGYIMVSIENRGAKVPRGVEWRKSVYKQIGLLAAEDQANGIVKMGEMFPFIDMERIGITGWSGGGSTTLQCMFRYPKIFSAGVAIAFVSHQKLYDSIYQERYMNTPQNNPEGYEKTAIVNFAQYLEGDVMLIHGTADDNVHYQSLEMLTRELIKHGKNFWMMSYPMCSHGIFELEGSSDHVKQTRARFWQDRLPAGGR